MSKYQKKISYQLNYDGIIAIEIVDWGVETGTGIRWLQVASPDAEGRLEFVEEWDWATGESYMLARKHTQELCEEIVDFLRRYPPPNELWTERRMFKGCPRCHYCGKGTKYLEPGTGRSICRRGCPKPEPIAP